MANMGKLVREQKKMLLQFSATKLSAERARTTINNRILKDVG